MKHQWQAPGSSAPYFSTFLQKNNAIRKGQKSYYCYLCKMKHLLNHRSDVRLLVLSDSLMSNSWKCSDTFQHPGTERLGTVKGHIDMEVKSGATIAELTNILADNYLNISKVPINVVFVCGINDVICGSHAQDVLENIFILKKKARHTTTKKPVVNFNFAIGSKSLQSLYI